MMTPEMEIRMLLRAVAATISVFLWVSALSAQASLLKDIHPGYVEASSGIAGLTSSGGLVYFRATSPVAGYELWVSDGTSSGTHVLVDLGAGPGITQIQNEMAALNGGLLFSTNIDGFGFEPWFTDGSPSGTFRLSDINSGLLSSNPGKYCVVGGIAYFVATDQATGAELWRTDGTIGGTMFIRDINPGTTGSAIDWITAFGGEVLFAASNGTQGLELWKSDGTTAGTTLVLDINNGAGSSNPSNFCVAGSRVFFAAADATTGNELWLTDGTTGGTMMVADIDAGVDGSWPLHFAALGSNVFFSAADNGSIDREPWFSDGTAAGTLQLADIATGTTSSISSSSTWVISMGAYVLFSATSPALGTELYKSDGTASGTVLLADLIAGSGSSQPRDFAKRGSECFIVGSSGLYKSDGTTGGTVLVSDASVQVNNGTALALLGSNLLFAGALNGVSDAELMISDGTGPGTQQLKNINFNATGCSPGSIVAFNGGYLFRATDVANGEELWFTDGTPSGTALLKDVRQGGASSSIAALTVLGSMAIFRANDGVNGFEPWVTDGTTAGTQMIKDINPGTANGTLSTFAVLNGVAYFSATDPTNGQELWRTDGTVGGTYIVRDIRAGSAGSIPTGFCAAGGLVYFSASDGTNGAEPWATDGTTAGTSMLKDIRNGGLASSSPTNFFAFASNVLFLADDGVAGQEMWFSDGTTAGTILLRDINPGIATSQSTQLMFSGGLVFFRATTAAEGAELWRTDGTTAGTFLVEDIRSGTASGLVSGFFAYAGGVLFSADDGSSGAELWFSDGTASGTIQIADTMAGSGNGSPAGFTQLGGSVIFYSGSGAEGQELWITDGTVAGTQMVRDIWPGIFGSRWITISFTVLGTSAYFIAAEPVEGLALWKTDGTSAGTVLVDPIVGGPTPIQPFGAYALGTKLLVYVGTPLFGIEPWIYDPNSTNVAPTVTLATSTHMYVENAAAALLDPAVTLTDPDSADFDGGQVTLIYSSGSSADNRLRVRNIGTAAGQVGVSGSSVSFGGVVVGTISGGIGTDLFVTLNSQSSVAAIQAVLRAIEFEVVGDNPSSATRLLAVAVSDGDGGTSITAQLSISVTPVNDATQVVVPTSPSSGFTGSPGGPFSITLPSASASLGNAFLQLVDPDNLMSISNVSVSVPAPGSIIGPQVQAGLSTGHLISWTGLAANTLPGTYIWTVDVQDGLGNTVVFIVTIILLNDAPTFQYGSDVTQGAGSQPNPYFANSVVGAQPNLQVATVLDSCAVQSQVLGAITPDAANPSNVFNFSMASGPIPRTLFVVTTAPLAAGDAGSHKFAVDVSDGIATSTLYVSISVAVSANLAPVVVSSPGGQFTGTSASGFLLQLDAGSTATGVARLEVSDPEGDPVTIQSVTINPYAPNTILGPTVPGPGTSGFIISFNGQINPAETPGDYIWSIAVRDTASNTTSFTATIRIRDAVPTHQIGPEAYSGSGTSGDPYVTVVAEGWFDPLQMFQIIDPNTSQTHTIASVTPGGSNPTGGSGFQWSVSVVFKYAIADPPLPLNSLDVGVHDFTVVVTDGSNNVTVHVRITVISTGGGGNSEGDDGGCSTSVATGALPVILLIGTALGRVRRRRD